MIASRGDRHPLGGGLRELVHGPRGRHRPVAGRRGTLHAGAVPRRLALLAGADAIHAGSRAGPVRIVRPRLDGAGEPGEGELRIGEEAAVETVVAPEVACGGIDLDDPGALRKRCVLDVPHLLEELPADEEHEVRIADRGANLGVVAEGERAHAGVPGGCVHLHRDDVSEDVGPDPLREPHELLHRSALRHPIAGEHDGPLGAEHETRGLRHPFRIRAGPAPDARRRDRRVRGPLVHHVERQGDEHRAGRRVQRDLERPVHELGQLARRLRLDAPLGERRGHRDEVVPQHRLAEPVAGVLLACGHHEGRAPLPGVVERPHRVPEPGTDVEVRHPDPPGRLRPRVRHGHRDRLLEGQDVPNRGIVLQGVHERKLGRPGVAEEVLDSFGDQGLHHDLAPCPGP